MYEFTFGARKSASSFAPAIQPARKERKSSPSSANAFEPSRQRLMCTWHELPIQVWSGLAMKVTEQPFWCAISLAPFL